MNHKTWIEKYRPLKLHEIIDQDNIVKILSNTLDNLPHLIFYGNPGTGKTSTILALCHELFGSSFSEKVLELNASNECGINVVRKKITTFTKIVVTDKYKYKIIILDEADELTFDAQSALRKLIEISSKNTRFCFICNNINKIIQPIRSRCLELHFKKISNKKSFEKLKSIVLLENIKIKDKDINNIFEMSDGDLRKSINLLQNIIYLNKIGLDDIYLITPYISDKVIQNIINELMKNIPINTILKITEKLINMGYSIYSIIKTINKKIIENDNISDKNKSLISIRLNFVIKMLIDNSDEFIQLLGMLTYINNVFNERINDITRNSILY